jgi:GNAT superfamily N-acetyltransferase
MVVNIKGARLPAPHAAPTGLLIEALECDVADIAAAAAAATTRDHVDFAIWAGVDRAEYWRLLLNGEGPCGSILPAASRLARRDGGNIVGAAVVTEMKATDWWAAGDPWLPEIFVVPDFQGRGLGAVLLGHALRSCAQAGYERFGLTVSESNPARHLYDRFGFQPFRATWFIER